MNLLSPILHSREKLKFFQFNLLDLRFNFQDSRYKVWDTSSRFKIQALRLKIQDLRFKTYNSQLKIQDLKFTIHRLIYKIQDLKFIVETYRESFLLKRGEAAEVFITTTPIGLYRNLIGSYRKTLPQTGLIIK